MHEETRFLAPYLKALRDAVRDRWKDEPGECMLLMSDDGYCLALTHLGKRVETARGASFQEATTNLVAKIKPKPDLAVILGIEP